MKRGSSRICRGWCFLLWIIVGLYGFGCGVLLQAEPSQSDSFNVETVYTGEALHLSAPMDPSVYYQLHRNPDLWSNRWSVVDMLLGSPELPLWRLPDPLTEAPNRGYFRVLRVPATAAFDEDEDGLRDHEELVGPTDPLRTDTDGDGYGDGLERETGSDPTDAGSRPTFALSGEVVNGAFTTASVEVLAVSNPADWEGGVARHQPASGAFTLEGVPAYRKVWLKAYRDTNGNARFDPGEPASLYRHNPIYVRGPLEGLVLYFPNPSEDRDGDGLSDAAEMSEWGTDPNAADTDRDGLSDAEELAQGSDPTLADTDGDGLPDGLDASPRIADRDADGLPDAWEAQYGGLSGVDPFSDADEDGAIALDEYRAGSDPRDPLDVPQEVAHYRFDRWSGHTAGVFNAVQDRHHGVVQGPVIGTVGGVVRCLDFSSGGEAYVEVPDHAELRLEKGLTVAFWLWVEVLSEQWLLEKSRLGTYGVRLGEDGGLWFHQRSTVDAGTWAGLVAPAGSIVPGRWQHVAVTRDAQEGVLRGYIDGIEVGRVRTVNAQGPLLVTEAPLRIGAGHSGEGVVGRLDEVRLYAYPLRAEVLIDLMDEDNDGLYGVEETARTTNPMDADSDGDGLGDGEEVARGLDPTNADADGDGWSDGYEVAVEADPLVPGIPSAAGNQVTNGGFEEQGGWGDFTSYRWGSGHMQTEQVEQGAFAGRRAQRVHFDGSTNDHDFYHIGQTVEGLRPGASYILSYWMRTEGRNAYSGVEVQARGPAYAGAWVLAGGTSETTSPWHQYVAVLPLPAEADRVHVRLRQSYSPGSSGTILYDQIAVRLDTDQDLLPDAWEVAHGLDPEAATAPDADLDGDGIGVYGEFAHGTDPRAADTDGDGLPDAWEVFAGFNPRVRSVEEPGGEDVDGDGFTQLEEYEAGSDARDPRSTPRRAYYVAPVAIGIAQTGHIDQPFARIQQAVDAAGPGDRVVLLDGVYTGAGNRDVLVEGKVIEIWGAGGAARCQIDAEGVGRAFRFAGSAASESLIQGVGILNGRAPDEDPFGGAVLVESAALRLEGCIIEGSVAEWGWGRGARARCAGGALGVPSHAQCGGRRRGAACERGDRGADQQRDPRQHRTRACYGVRTERFRRDREQHLQRERTLSGRRDPQRERLDRARSQHDCGL